MATVAVILAAGMGKRMKSNLPKVLHPVLGKPMVQRAAETAEAAGIDSVCVVVGHGREWVVPLLDERGWNWAVQEEQLGTAHAVMCSLPLPEDSHEVVVLLGDVPLLREETVGKLLESRREADVPLAVLTTSPPDVTGYGRIILDQNHRILRIVEEKDASPEEKAVTVINTGIMAFSAHTLQQVLPQIGNTNSQKEFYLTDAVSLLADMGTPALSVFTDDWEEVAGVNNPIQLARCTDVMKQRVVQQHLLMGVTIPDPSSVWIEDTVTIGRGAFIGRNCRLSGDTVIGQDAIIGDGAIIEGGLIPAGEQVAEYTVLGVD